MTGRPSILAMCEKLPLRDSATSGVGRARSARALPALNTRGQSSSPQKPAPARRSRPLAPPCAHRADVSM